MPCFKKKNSLYFQNNVYRVVGPTRLDSRVKKCFCKIFMLLSLLFTYRAFHHLFHESTLSGFWKHDVRGLAPMLGQSHPFWGSKGFLSKYFLLPFLFTDSVLSSFKVLEKYFQWILRLKCAKFGWYSLGVNDLFWG